MDKRGPEAYSEWLSTITWSVCAISISFFLSSSHSQSSFNKVDQVVSNFISLSQDFVQLSFVCSKVRHVCVGPWRGGLVLGAVEEVPDEDGVVVGAAHDLELVELKPEHAARMLDQGPDAKGTAGCPGILGSVQIPDLDLAVVSSGHDAVVVEADAADQLFVTFEDSQTGAALDVPQPDGVVRGPADHEVVVVLQAGDPAFVTVQGSDELAGT